MEKTYTLDHLGDIKIDISRPSIVFLYGDLAAGKTTLSKKLISQFGTGDEEVTSPTYVYYNKYNDIYHFDLYRMKNYDEFVSIGGEEIIDNNEGIIIIEWPELLEKYYIPDVKIYLTKTEKEDTRKIEIKYIKNKTCY